MIVGGEDMPIDQKKGAIRMALAKQLTGLRQCYSANLKNTDIDEGQMVLEWDIDTKGLAQKIQVNTENSTVHNEGLGKCLTAVVATSQFPPTSPGKETHIKYPFVFHRNIE